MVYTITYCGYDIIYIINMLRYFMMMMMRSRMLCIARIYGEDHNNEKNGVTGQHMIPNQLLETSSKNYTMMQGVNISVRLSGQQLGSERKAVTLSGLYGGTMGQHDLDSVS
ncbi:hypothetical protein BDA99DRAFT_542963 [Phascolomyces articulosus]|uniref:Uncharacterized protein n=1 Tax=Phascolomyces articulosus TaxID=60185 RepID=A0AAD5JNP7_9FUNG|nr:hypothetical protein BDA99DRAFT_542963 [Phascolomyces articulosus]